MFRHSFISFAIIIALSIVIADPPKLKLPHGGVLVGSYMKTANGRIIQAYRGIPYAEPPVGELRFAAPVAARTWSGENLADKDAEICPQLGVFQGTATTYGNEDCLYLNVYIKKKRNNQQSLPVMFYIHGGGWFTGGGTSVISGPGRLLDHDVILVTSNYRLGPFGFFSTGTIDFPGNNGLKDQVLALEWVQKNIKTFGGNPKDVTLFGQSAGGASVTYHMVSPLSKGLFHKAIIQSGTYFEPWALGNISNAPIQARKLGKLLNCSTTEGQWTQMIDCLRTKPANAIISTQPDFIIFLNYPLTAFPPVVEPDFKGAFLTKQPRDIDISHSASIPVIIGVTADDGLVATASLLHLYNDVFKSKFREVLPLMLYYDDKDENIRQEITNKIDEFYFQGSHDWTKENHQNLTNLFSDRLFYAGMNDYLRRRISAQKDNRAGDTYVYLFDHRGPKSFTELFQGGTEYYGVSHCDELYCLFVIGNDTSIPTGNDAIMKWAMPYMWTNFAKTGNPTPPGPNITKWKRANKFPLRYAHVGSKFSEGWTLLRNEIGFQKPRNQFWAELRRHYNLL